MTGSMHLLHMSGLDGNSTQVPVDQNETQDKLSRHFLGKLDEEEKIESPPFLHSKTQDACIINCTYHDQLLQ